jgi:hypothetical protein
MVHHRECAGRLSAGRVWTPQPPDRMHQVAGFFGYSDTDIPAPAPDGYDTEATWAPTPLTEWQRPQAGLVLDCEPFVLLQLGRWLAC